MIYRQLSALLNCRLIEQSHPAAASIRAVLLRQQPPLRQSCMRTWAYPRREISGDPCTRYDTIRDAS